MPLYRHILKRDIKLAFNVYHGDDGKFTDASHSVVESGHAGITQTRRYGGDHAKAQGAAVEASNRARGSRNKGIQIDVNSYFGINSNAKLRVSNHAGVYPHAKDDGTKQVQSVQSDVTLVDRQKVSTLQAQTNSQLYDASMMKAGLYGKNAVIFQSNPHDKARDQVSKKIILHAGKGTFTSLAHATKALEDSGLHGYAMLYKEAHGYSVHIDIPKQHSAHGNGLRALAVLFRRKYGLTGEHFNGNRTLVRTNNVESKVKAQLSNRAGALDKYEELKAKYSKGK